MVRSPPPSPSKLFHAQLLVAKSAAHGKQAKKIAAAKSSAGKENTSLVSPKARKQRSIAISWSTQKNHHLSHSLLGIIEDNPVYKVALGFDKGDVGAVSSGGKKVVERYQSIARKLFINVQGSEWSDTNEHVKQLGESVKNRVTAMKKAYAKHWASISETGQGLLDAGKEDEIVPGSEIANIWDDVKKKFPWYMQMHALMGASPIISKSAIANSTTTVDLSLLDRAANERGSTRYESPPWQIEADDGQLPLGSSPRNSHVGSPNLDKSDDESGSDSGEDDEDKDDREVGRTSASVSAGPSTPVSMPRGQKCKSITDSIAEVSAREQGNRIKIAKINAAAKTERWTQREKNMELELARMQHQRDEAAAQRAHEAVMYDKQVALELARAGRAPPPFANIDPHLR